MKPKGKHPCRSLTAVKVKSLNKPGRYADGDCLYLFVDKSGAKRWILRTKVRRRRRDIGLGGIEFVSLAEAREQALLMRKAAKAGDDPLALKRSRRATPTFAEAAETVHKIFSPSWRNHKHAAQWIGTLRTYAFPLIGTHNVSEIESGDIAKLLEPIWRSKPETARRVLQRIGTVMNWARTAGYRTGDNPINAVPRGLPSQNSPNRHHAALPFSQVPQFLLSLQHSENSEPARLAFEFLVLTATRTSEVLHLSWEEIVDDVWTIPLERTKSKREHRIPLGPRCLEILQIVRRLSEADRYVFPGRTRGKPLSNMVFLMAIRRMRLLPKITAHGFRSSFTDWAHEHTEFGRTVIEMALNHQINNKTEAAYRRGDLFEKRRKLMLAWERFALSHPSNQPGNLN